MTVNYIADTGAMMLVFIFAVALVSTGSAPDPPPERIFHVPRRSRSCDDGASFGRSGLGENFEGSRFPVRRSHSADQPVPKISSTIVLDFGSVDTTTVGST